MRNKKSIVHGFQNSDRLKISVQDSDAAVISEAVHTVRMRKVEKRCQEMVRWMNKAGRTGYSGEEVLAKLRQTGQMLCNTLLPSDVREKLRNTRATCLQLTIDDDLVHIPWELLEIGDAFLCQRFSMGRLVQTRHDASGVGQRGLSEPLRMWILACPGQGLDHVISEGMAICAATDRVNADGPVTDAVFDSQATPDQITEGLKQYDVVHFAGHAEYNVTHPGRSGWKTNAGRFSAEDVRQLRGGSAMPALVFSNACQSACTGKWRTPSHTGRDIFGLVNAFMLAGVRHYLGSSWDIPDASGSAFALEFYRHLLSGENIGEAVRQARSALTDKGSESCWTSYVLYGDPTACYVGNEGESEEVIRLSITTEAAEKTLPPLRGMISGLPFPFVLGCLVILAGLVSMFATYWIMQGPHSQPSQSSGREIKVSPETLRILEEKERARKARIAELFRELEKITQRNKNASDGAPAETPGKEDGWTSRPLTLTLLFDPSKSSIHQEKDRYIAALIESQLIEKGGVTLLERMSFDSILEELKYANSQVVPPENRILPSLLTPRLILSIELVHIEAMSFVLMHLAVTKTSEIMDVITEPLPSLSDSDMLKKKLSERLLEKLGQRPIRGKILSVEDGKIVLNIGEAEGVRIGQQFRVLGQSVILRTESLRADGTSTARAEKEAVQVRADLRVEVRGCLNLDLQN